VLELCQPPADCVWAEKLPHPQQPPPNLDTPKSFRAMCNTNQQTKSKQMAALCPLFLCFSFVIGGRYGFSCCYTVTISKVSLYGEDSIKSTTKIKKKLHLYKTKKNCILLRLFLLYVLFIAYLHISKPNNYCIFLFNV